MEALGKRRILEGARGLGTDEEEVEEAIGRHQRDWNCAGPERSSRTANQWHRAGSVRATGVVMISW